MRVVPLTADSFAIYASWWAERGLPAPPPGNRAIMLAEGDQLVSGQMLYTTDGPYLLLEHFATNPKVSPRLGHRACKMNLEIAKGLAAMEGKTPITLAGKKGIVALLEQSGWKLEPELKVFVYREPG